MVAGAQRRRAAGGDGRRLQPHHARPAPTRQSVLDQIVPGYYHRLLDDGTVANSTCCANTAPEHAMMGKLVVDSIVTWAKAVQGGRLPVRPDGPPPEGEHPGRPRGARRADRRPRRRGRQEDPALRRGLELRRGRRRRPLRPGHPGQHGRHRHRHVQRPAARRGTRRRAVRRATRGVQGFASGLFTDPNGDAGQRLRRRAAGPAAARPGPDQGGADRQPARLPVHRLGRQGRSPAPRSTTTARRPATPPRPARRSPTSTRTTTRSCTTRWPTSCRQAPRRRTGPGCRCWRWRTAVLGPGRRVRHRGHRAAALEVAGPQLVQLRRLVQRRSAGTAPTATASAPACRRQPTTRTSGRTPSRCWPTRRWCRAARRSTWPTPATQELLRDPARPRRCSA